jgi:hypothetical protein
MEPFVTRWIVKVAEGRYAIVDDEEDLEDWDDTVLEITIPATAATMFDSIMHAYYGMQTYLDAQWMIMESKLSHALPAYETETGGVSGDDLQFIQAFNTIVKDNNLEQIHDDVLDDPDDEQ